MKRNALSLLLILALLIPCAICPAYADPTGDADALVGRWEAVCDFSPLFIFVVDTQITPGYSRISVNEIPSFDTFIDALPFSIFLEFHEDGTVTSGFVNVEQDLETVNAILDTAFKEYNSVTVMETILFMYYEETGKLLHSIEELEQDYGNSADTFCISVTGQTVDRMAQMYFNVLFTPMKQGAFWCNLDSIANQLVYESSYSVENGRLLIESPALTMYEVWPPYYTLSADTLNLNFTDYMAVNDMDADDIEELYQNEDFAFMFPSDYDFKYEMSWGELASSIKGSLLPFYDLTYTRA